MTTKERIIEQINQLGEAELLEIEKEIRERASQAKVKRQLEEEFRLLDELAAPMSEEDKTVFRKNIRTRFL